MLFTFAQNSSSFGGTFNSVHILVIFDTFFILSLFQVLFARKKIMKINLNSKTSDGAVNVVGLNVCFAVNGSVD